MWTWWRSSRCFTVYSAGLVFQLSETLLYDAALSTACHTVLLNGRGQISSTLKNSLLHGAHDWLSSEFKAQILFSRNVSNEFLAIFVTSFAWTSFTFFCDSVDPGSSTREFSKSDHIFFNSSVMVSSGILISSSNASGGLASGTSSVANDNTSWTIAGTFHIFVR